MRTIIHISLLLLVLFCAGTCKAVEPKTITFPAKDGIEITADLYMAHPDTVPFIILFHQAGWSRGEYKEIAPQLNAMGYNCMAVDLRSGDAINNIVNQTHQQAVKAKKNTTYLDAYTDMESALTFAKSAYAKGKLIVWGSSYSAALVLRLASQHDNIHGVVAFSPGEYFSRLGQSSTFIQEAAASIAQPVFITSARAETEQWKALYNVIPSKAKTSFIPETAGNHGSRSLWKANEDNEGYWKAVTAFLHTNFPAQ